MYQTDYHRPTTLSDAVRLLGEGDGEAKYLSGGMTLLPTMKARLASPSALVDLRHIAELKGISVSGRRLRVGGGTTHYELSQAKEIEALCPAITHLAALIGDPAVRHMGTMGGVVANFDPAADYPAMLLALGGTIHTDRREIAADDYFLGLFETALEEGEIVTAVSFEAPQAAGWEKFRNPASRYAMAAVFVAKKDDGSVGVGVTGASASGAFRWREAEEALGANFDASALDGLEVSEGEMMGDIHGSSQYRAHLVRVVAQRAVRAAKD